jgi:putative transposase
MDWARILAYVTGTVDQELLARNEYLAAENRIIKAQLKGRLKLSDAKRGVLGEIGHRLGRQVSCRRRHHSPARDHSRLVSQACCPQV